MSDLSRTQLAVLRATDRRYRDSGDLMNRARDHGWLGETREGLCQTLASLVRRGLVERAVLLGGRVHWQLTDKGSAAERSYPR